MLSLRDLVGELDVRVLAGEAGLDTSVRSVHTSDLLDPTPWLAGGELLLTTGAQLDSPARQRKFVARLAEHGVAALGVGTGFAHQQVPASLLDVAAERDFPLLEVPHEVPFIAITEAAFARLLGGSHSVLRGGIEAQDRLEQVALAELGLDALVEALAALIGGAALVFDARGTQLAAREFREPLRADVLSAMRAAARAHALARDGRGADLPSAARGVRGLALPVGADAVALNGGSASPGEPQAWLVGVKHAGELSQVDRLALRQAVTIVALELRRSRLAEEAERRLAGDVFDAIVSGELTGGELTERLAQLGLADTVAVIALAPPEAGTDCQPAAEAVLVAALRRERTVGLVASHGPLVCALVAGLPEDDLFDLARRVNVRIAAALGTDALLGVGRAVSGADAVQSLNEARSALEARASALSKFATGDDEPIVAREPQLATYRDLGSFELFLSLQDVDALRRFCDAVLGLIDQTKGPYGGELLHSLDVFIDENGQWDRAAKRLYCHRHTLRYRLRKVEELTGRNLENARDRIEFWLALRGRELLPAA